MSFLLTIIFAIVEMAPRRQHGLNPNEEGQVPNEDGPVVNEVPAIYVNSALYEYRGTLNSCVQ